MKTVELAPVMRIHPEHVPQGQIEAKGRSYLPDILPAVMSVHSRENTRKVSTTTVKLFPDNPASTARMKLKTEQRLIDGGVETEYMVVVGEYYNGAFESWGSMVAQPDGQLISEWRNLSRMTQDPMPPNADTDRWETLMEDVSSIAMSPHFADQAQNEALGDSTVSHESLDNFFELCSSWIGAAWPDEPRNKRRNNNATPADRLARAISVIQPDTIIRATTVTEGENESTLTTHSDAHDIPNQVTLFVHEEETHIPNTRRHVPAKSTAQWVFAEDETRHYRTHKVMPMPRDRMSGSVRGAVAMATHTKKMINPKNPPEATHVEALEGISKIQNLLTIKPSVPEIQKEPLEPSNVLYFAAKR